MSKSIQDIQDEMEACKEMDTYHAHQTADGLLCELATLLASQLDSEAQQKVQEILQVYGWLDKWYE